MDYELYRNLVNLLKIFERKPNQLAKFLIDNDAFNTTFQNNIKLSHQLKIDNLEIENHFTTIDELNDYRNFLIFEKVESKSKSAEELGKELSKKLQDAIDKENYEEAARLRDYMKKNNLKKN